MSATLAAVPVSVCTTPLSASTPTWAFIPKYHCLPLRVWCICGTRALALFLVEGGGDDRGVNERAFAQEDAPLAQSALTSAKMARVSSCRSSRWRKCSSVVASGTASPPSSMPTNVRNA